jgi:hypothetical protein
MVKENRNYVLIGPGRWGTRDQFLGIPVIWTQISNAKVIVEVSLENYPLDSSLGSHFFHNVTSMTLGIFPYNTDRRQILYCGMNWNNSKLLLQQHISNMCVSKNHSLY